MNEVVKVPFLGVNDLDCKLSSIESSDGSFVNKGSIICVVETTKTSYDIITPVDGYFYCYPKIGDTLKVGDLVAIISAAKSIKDELYKETIRNLNINKVETIVTKKAELLANSLGLNLAEINAFYSPGTRITEQLIKDYNERIKNNYTRIGIKGVERIGIIGGASGGGALILIDSILKSGSQRAVCIFDKSPEFVNKEILGVPVVGNLSLIQEWIQSDKIDSVIIAFNRNLDERKSVFEDLIKGGIPFTNIIDQKADIRSGVNIGIGNIILGQSYIGACTQIGNNNFISANVSLEHGNILGSHCAFGPAVYTSGNVTIGSKIRFATGIFIEPGIMIGDNAIIASGSIITTNIQENEVVKHKK